MGFSNSFLSHKVQNLNAYLRVIAKVVYLMSVRLTGVCLMGMHLTGMHLIAVYIMGVHLMTHTSWVCTS
jgi:hypothetical protein